MSRESRRSKEEENANCYSNNTKKTNGKKKRQEWILDEIEIEKERYQDVSLEKKP